MTAKNHIFSCFSLCFNEVTASETKHECLLLAHTFIQGHLLWPNLLQTHSKKWIWNCYIQIFFIVFEKLDYHLDIKTDIQKSSFLDKTMYLNFLSGYIGQYWLLVCDRSQLWPISTKFGHISLGDMKSLPHAQY